jgi:protein-disulfide isomerase
MKTFPGQIRLIFKEFPLEIHSQADLAAAAAVAANKQGKFWEMHDQMFANRDDLSRKNILAMATRTGLDMKRFEDDIDSTEVRETVVRDVQDGGDAGVEGTPTIFINGQKYNSAIRSDLLKPIVEAELKHAQPSVRQSASAR